MPITVGKSEARPDEAKSRRLFELINAEVAEMSLGDRLALFSAFKRGDAWADLDPGLQDAFRSVAAQL